MRKVEGEVSQRSGVEEEVDARLLEIARRDVGTSGPQWNNHLLALLKRQTLSRMLYFDRLYREILETPGVICEFGVQRGAALATLINLRGVYEPYNHTRRVIGFDTFSGFTEPTAEDGPDARTGDYAVPDGYEAELEALLTLHEQGAPLSHMKKFELVKGDAGRTFPGWLEANPHAVVALAIFDMDLYAPTKSVLDAIKPRLTRGSLLVFDQLNHLHFPGETLAVMESVGLGNLRFRRVPWQPYGAWAAWEG